MTRKEYNKLVRDRIPEIIRQSGRECETFIMDEMQYKNVLKMKLIEESEEVVNAKPEELIKELADVFEVVDGIIEIYGLDKDSILEEQKKRKEKRGSFTNRTCLVWAESEELTFPLIVGAETSEGRERIREHPSLD